MSQSNDAPYDVIVVGAGPAGYVAAIRAAQLGLRTACVDDFTGRDGEASLGGTCLNVGCIPSKALLDSSEQFHKLTHDFQAHGIQADNPSMDVATMIARKDTIVNKLTGGIKSLFKANNIDSYHGRGRIVANSGTDHSVDVVKVHSAGVDDSQAVTQEVVARLNGTHIVIATGSVPIEIPSMAFDHQHIVDSTGALAFSAVPDRLGIIGAGVIGLELGSVWRRLGAHVVLLEAVDTFLPSCEPQVAREAQREFKKLGLDIRLSCRVNSATVNDGRVKIEFTATQGKSDLKETTEDSLEVDRLIVAVGRRPMTTGLFADGVNVTTDDRGFIIVDDNGHTNLQNIWAAGDVTPGPMLAHKGSEEGVAIAERIAGQVGHVNYDTIPWVIYTAPEIAWVGQTTAQAKAAGHTVVDGSFRFAATGRAMAMEDTSGFVKIIADAKTDRVLGVHMIGPHVSELIAEVVLAMEYGASSEDIARTVHAHPTLSEAVHEAALAVDKRAIHKAN